MSTKKKYRELTFTDDFMFCKVLEGNPELCRKILELILEKKISEVRFKNKQQIIEPSPDRKSIRLDVLLDDENNTIYDLEMQTQNKSYLPRRTRYYQSVMDVDFFGRGGKYKDMPDSYIVFICCFDPMGHGLPKYTFRELCDEDPSIALNDGTWKVFVNALSKEKKITGEMRAFLDYLNGKAPESDMTREIDECVKFARKNRVWETEYMQFINYWDLVADDAREEGHEEGLEQGLKQGIEQGLKQGLEQGLEQGERRLSRLIVRLMEDGRTEDVTRVVNDPEYRRSLYTEYGIIEIK